MTQHSILFCSGDLVANSTLRLLEPNCTLPKNWSEEPLTRQATRAVDEIYGRTVSYKLPGSGEKTTYDPFPAPTFAYMFYLLQSVLSGRKFRGGEFEETTKLNCLALVSSHASLRSSKKDGKNDVRIVYIQTYLLTDLFMFRFGYIQTCLC